MDASKLRGRAVRVHRTLVLALFLGLFFNSCSSLPKVKHTWHEFPRNAMIGEPKRPYESLGYVKAKVNFPTLDPDHDEQALCENYYNEAVRKLVKYAKRSGADAVVQIRSVVFLLDGRKETHKTAECVDEGGEGQVLTHGMAVKWIPLEKQRVKAESEGVR